MKKIKIISDINKKSKKIRSFVSKEIKKNIIKRRRREREKKGIQKIFINKQQLLYNTRHTMEEYKLKT